MPGHRLILASASPRRAELLRQAGFNAFDVVSPNVEESHDATLSPARLTIENAERKARAVAAQASDAVVIAADTLVYVDDEPLGKPDNLEQAVAMLKRLAGRRHQVCTGVALAGPGPAETETFATISHVSFKPLTEEQIHAYHQLCNPLDKAGGYGIQDAPDWLLARLEGSWSNVVGLPIEELIPRLRARLAY